MWGAEGWLEGAVGSQVKTKRLGCVTLGRWLRGAKDSTRDQGMRRQVTILGIGKMTEGIQGVV